VPDDKGLQMSDRDKAFAEYIAHHTVTGIVNAATNKDVAERVIDTWAAHVQRVVGRAVLRLLMYVCIGVVALASYKMGLLDRLAEVIKK